MLYAIITENGKNNYKKDCRYWDILIFIEYRILLNILIFASRDN